MPMLGADMFGWLNPMRMSGSNSSNSQTIAKLLLVEGKDIFALQKFFYRE